MSVNITVISRASPPSFSLIGAGLDARQQFRRDVVAEGAAQLLPVALG